MWKKEPSKFIKKVNTNDCPTLASYILKLQCLSVCVGSAWKILPVTARSLWSVLGGGGRESPVKHGAGRRLMGALCIGFTLVITKLLVQGVWPILSLSSACQQQPRTHVLRAWSNQKNIIAYNVEQMKFTMNKCVGF
jgi:hypothetical protein